MNSWKFFGTASAVLTFACCSANAQDCANPSIAVVGTNAATLQCGVPDFIVPAATCELGFSSEIIRSVHWFAFTAPETGLVTVSTCNNSNFDTRLAITTICGDGSAVIACNDDAAGCGGFTSELTFSADGGTTYYIALGSWHTVACTGSEFATMTISMIDPGCGSASNDCFTESSEPFCSDASCCGAVCPLDPMCCESAWDALCVDLAGQVCSGSGCGSSLQDCCVANSAPFCSDSACCSSVCSYDAWCCENSWDDICAGEAQSDPACTSCAPPPPPECAESEQDCCSAGEAPYCADSECCSAVCAADAFCCETQWDDVCASEAQAMCESCFVPCDGPVANVTEAEACGDDTNGGCNSGGLSSSETIAFGDVVAGTFWSSTSTRDTDWYNFTVTEPTVVTLNMYTSGPGLVGFVDLACTGFLASSAEGCPRTVTQCLQPGTYYVFAAPSAFVDLPCSSAGAAYTLELINAGECEPAGCGISEQDCCAANVEPYCSDADCCQSICLADPFCCNTQWDDLCAEAAQVQCASCMVPCDAPAPTGFEAESCGDDTNGGCNSGGLADSEPIAFGDIIAGTFWSDLATRDTDWYNFTITEATLVTVNMYTSGPGLVGLVNSVPCDAFVAAATTGCPRTVTACLEPGTYFVFASTSTWLDLPCGADGYEYTIELIDGGKCEAATCGNVPQDCCVPGVDPFCADAECCAAVCAADPFCCATQWDSLCADAAVVQCTNCGGSGSPDNDECDSPIAVFDGANAVSNLGATTGMPDTSPAECNSGPSFVSFTTDVWYSYTPTASGTVTFSTCSAATFDTRLELWDGCPDNGGVRVACNDDGTGCAGFTSIMVATLDCNVTYLVRLGGYNGASGTATLTITPGSVPCEEACLGDLNNDGVVNGADLGLLLAAWGTCSGCAADLNSDGVVNGADLGLLLAAWGSCN